MGAVLTFLSTLFVFSVVNGTPLLYGTLGAVSYTHLTLPTILRV